MKTIENNKLIAEFMGFETFAQNTKCYNPRYNDGTISPMKFDNDWMWLMPLVEKIINLKGVYAQKRQEVKESINPNIEKTYKTCVEFIKWYNLKNS